MRRALWVMAVAVLTGSCRCDAPLKPLSAASLRVDVTEVVFPPTAVGSSSRQTLVVTNTGEQSGTVSFSTLTPFSVSKLAVEVRGAATEEVEVVFTPQTVGLVEGALEVGPLTLGLRGEGVAPPSCTTTNFCERSTFDPQSGTCLTATFPDGAACGVGCVLDGHCQQGRCLGAPVDCGDGDACTVDSCSAEGCAHAPLSCPRPADACHVAGCDSQQGCLSQAAPDGTLCAPDDCTQRTVSVCIDGACVPRERPNDGRCSNRWLPLFIPGRRDFALTWDSTRQRLVVFGGEMSQLLGDTWDFDGTTWVASSAPVSPSPRSGVGLADEPMRHQVLLFGGLTDAGVSDETWEFDGTTWARRRPLTSPSARRWAAMAWDPDRHYVLLYGGEGAQGEALADTWAWDGRTWKQVAQPALRLRDHHSAMAYDAHARHMLLHEVVELWAWDAETWVLPSPGSSGLYGTVDIAFDAVRGRLVLLQSTFPHDSTWEWDGMDWSERTPVGQPQLSDNGRLTYDGAQGHVVAHTWRTAQQSVWDGNSWSSRHALAPLEAGMANSLAFDSTRQRVVAFPGRPGTGTWEWDGHAWHDVPTVAQPPARTEPALAYDPARKQVVLFGGKAGSWFDDTWTFDGVAWVHQSPAHSPPARSGAALVFDEVRQQLVLFGGSDPRAYNDTWAWDGTDWAQLALSSSPPQTRAPVMAWDGVRHHLLLLASPPLDPTALTDTWELTDTTWAWVTSTQPPVHSPKLAWDAPHSRVVLYAGSTWEWDGQRWAQRTPTVAPFETSGCQLTPDGQASLVLLCPASAWRWLP